jgi:hypothetical protein
MGHVSRESLISAATLGTGQAISSYRALASARAAGESVTLYHFTSETASAKILSSGVLNATTKGLWGSNGVYFGATKSASLFTKTILWGLPIARQKAVIELSIEANRVSWRPFGIRFVKEMVVKF